LSGADAIAYLPIDFTWVVRRFVKAFRPAHFILVESDFWPNLLRELRKNGTKISLVSGKMSEKSARRFALFPRFSQRLFAYFDHVCVQNEEHYQRFSPFCDPARLTIAGNLKFDIQAQPITRTLKLTRPAITISCTHAPEEELILNALIGGPWTLLLAPRHPERFGEVAALLQRKGLAFVRWSESQTGRLYRNNLKSREFGKESPQNSFPERATIALGQGVSEEAHFEANSTMPKTDSSGCFGIILIDAMGQLPLCYTHSDLAILGGSFIEGIGGHNILEPCLYGTPVFFGPFMRTQKEFVKRVLESKAGRQLPIEHLRQAVDEWFLNEELAHSMRKGTIDAIEVGRGATARTLAALQQ
ncbi:MAG: hypothetical protein KGQ49_05545, partial [Verrucomicrobia bacterium]|nr:hypothetical protein [Verrucomicrobiota bacterium]